MRDAIMKSSLDRKVKVVVRSVSWRLLRSCAQSIVDFFFFYRPSVDNTRRLLRTVAPLQIRVIRREQSSTDFGSPFNSEASLSFFFCTSRNTCLNLNAADQSRLRALSRFRSRLAESLSFNIPLGKDSSSCCDDDLSSRRE